VLLDLGCGAGEKANQLRDFQVDVVGIDNLLEPLRRAGGLGASAKAKVGVFNIVQADITRLPFPADSFDGAHDYLAFLHVVRGDWDAYVRAVQTVLRPGAPLLIVTFSASDLDFYGVPIQGSANRGLVFAGAIAGEPSRAAHLVNSYFYFATETELTQLFREHFDVVEMAEIAHPLSSTSPDHRFRRLWHVLLRKR